jgi:hypothetical protein
MIYKISSYDIFQDFVNKLKKKYPNKMNITPENLKYYFDNNQINLIKLSKDHKQIYLNFVLTSKEDISDIENYTKESNIKSIHSDTLSKIYKLKKRKNITIKKRQKPHPPSAKKRQKPHPPSAKKRQKPHPPSAKQISKSPNKTSKKRKRRVSTKNTTQKKRKKIHKKIKTLK